MAKLLEVKEFDSITRNVDFENDENFKYLDAVAFQNLIEFIREFSEDNEIADILNFMRVSYKRNIGDVITIRNYVGLIQIKNGYQVQVLPKISFGEYNDVGNQETKKVFLRMLKSMKNSPGILGPTFCELTILPPV